MAHGPYGAGGVVCCMLLDGPAETQVGKLGSKAAKGQSTASDEHVACVL
jgi:hypothetical protein